MPNKIIICPSCGQRTEIEDMNPDHTLCEGCMESLADIDYYNDPHGRGWTNDNDYNTH